MYATVLNKYLRSFKAADKVRQQVPRKKESSRSAPISLLANCVHISPKSFKS